MPAVSTCIAHIAGPKVNVARKMRPEEKRKTQVLHRTANTHSGTLGSVPSTFATGYKYAGMGYTTAFDAAIPPLGARHAHEEFEDTPCIDKGFYVLMGNTITSCARSTEGAAELKAFIAWLLGANEGLRAEARQSGRRGDMKSQQGGNAHNLDQVVDHFDVTPRQIIGGSPKRRRTRPPTPGPHSTATTWACRQLAKLRSDTMKALDGHGPISRTSSSNSYGGGEGDENTFKQPKPCRSPSTSHAQNVTIDVAK